MLQMINYEQAFTILGIELTTDRKAIKRAYAQLIREYHPEEQPEEWQRIHDAYECAMNYAGRNQEKIVIQSEKLGDKSEFAKKEVIKHEPKKDDLEFDFDEWESLV